MSRSLIALSGLALALSAVPASATIQVFQGAGSVQPDENVLFNGAPAPSGNDAYGVTNQTGTGVTFMGNEALATPSGGQARVTGADGTLTQLDFGLTDGTKGFKEVEFNIFRQQATATSVDLSFFDQFGTAFTNTFTIGNGSNFFSARAIDDQFITNVSFTLNGTARDVRQVRIGGFGDITDGGGSGSDVPEPATWAMLIAGFGMVGAAARRRKTTVSLAA